MWSSPIKTVLTAVIFLLLVGCQPEVTTLPAAPTPAVWRVNITPALRWLGPAFQKCAAEVTGAALVLEERSAAVPETVPVDFSFQWGERKPPATASIVLLQEEVAVIVHPGNPLESLSVEALQGLYATQAEHWKEACPTCTARPDGPLQTYAYATGEDTQAAAPWIVPGPRTRLAPDPEAVRQAVAKDPYALGFVPAHWVDASVKRVRLSGTLPGPLSAPVLASTSAEPQGSQRAWLVCVQDQIR